MMADKLKEPFAKFTREREAEKFAGKEGDPVPASVRFSEAAGTGSPSQPAMRGGFNSFLQEAISLSVLRDDDDRQAKADRTSHRLRDSVTMSE